MRWGPLLACLGVVAGCQGSPEGETRAPASPPSVQGSTQVFIDTSPHQHGFADLGGVTLHFLDWGGSGEVLLLIPGLGNTPHTFDDFAPHFTSRYRVVGLTLRGHGQSDRPPAGYDTRTLVEDVRAFADLLGVSTFSLVGASIGSDVLTGLASAYPERVNRLVYLDEAADPAEIAESGKLEAFPPGLASQPSRAAFRSKFWTVFEGAGVWTPALEADMHFGQSVGPNGKVEAVLTDALAGEFIKGKALPDHSRIRARTLAIFARGFVWEIIPPERREAQRALSIRVTDAHVERFKRLVPHAEIVVLEGAAHPVLIHRAAEVRRLAKAFLMK